MQLDTLFQLPNFSRNMNGEAIDSWVYILSTYFNTFLGITKEEKLQISSLQLEGISQSWWDAQHIPPLRW
jgi:hypothetical protein